MSSRNTGQLVILITLVWTLCACNKDLTQTSGPTEVRVAISADIRSSYPGVNRISLSDDVLIHVVEPLVVHRDDLSIAPMAAQSYEISEDNKIYRFHLRQGMRFHNGEKVQASHVVSNWQTILKPATGFQCLPFYDGSRGARLISITAENESTLRFEFDRPNAVFLEQLAYIQCPVAILHPDSWDAAGNWVKPIGTGPYQFSEWKKNQYVLLQKFDGYLSRNDPPSGLAGRKTAYIDAIRYVIITDLMAEKAALVSGQIDVVGSLAPITALELRHNNRVVVIDKQGLSRRTLLIQTDDPLLADVNLRRALAHALELTKFAEVATLGLSEHNPSTIPESSPNHLPLHSIPYEYDVEKSRALQKKAGYNGEEIVLKTTRTEQAYFDMAMIAESMLTNAGFNIRIEVVDLGTLLSDYFDGNYQIMAFEYSPRMAALMNYQTLIGDKQRSPNKWGDAAANELMAEAAMTSDSHQQQLLFDKIHTRMMSEVPVINIYNAPVIDAISPRLHNYQAWSGAKPRLWNVRVNATTNFQ